MNILFLADTHPPTTDLNYRTTYNKYRYDEVFAKELADIPHGVLLGPTLLATVLAKAGHSVQVLECAGKLKQKERLFSALKMEPDIVCISTTYIFTTYGLRSLTELVQLISPQSIVVIGGPSINSNKEMRTLGDYYILGEGETTLPLLVEALSEGITNPKIPGVYSSEDPNQCVASPLIQDMDLLPFPNWSLLRRNKDDMYVLATQRGCPWRCTFCTYPAKEGFKLRYRSIENIILEMTSAYQKFGIWRYLFADSTFTAPVNRCADMLKAFCDLPFQIEWMGFARVDNITPELADLMVRSGCISVFLGLESGNAQILKNMRKGFKVDQIRQGVSLLRERGINITGSWLIGFPGETAETVKDTVDLIAEVGCHQNYLGTFVLEQEAPIFKRRQKYGVSGMETHWHHETMDYREALELTDYYMRKLSGDGVVMGHHFEFSWMSSIGFSPERVRSFFQMAQNEAAQKAAGYPLSDNFLGELTNIRLASKAHPIYAGGGNTNSTY